MSRNRLAALALAVVCATHAFAEPTVDDVLSRVRAAIGYERMAAQATGLQFSGTGRFLGNDVTLSGFIGNRGEYVRKMAGPIPYDTGWDGQVAWRSEFSGWSRVLAAGERNEQRIEAAVMSGAWLAKDSPLRFTSVSHNESAARVTLGFELRDGFESGTVEIDERAALPVRWTYGAKIHERQAVSIERWHDFGGMKIPARVISASAGSDATVTDIDAVSAAPVFVRSPFQVPPRASDDIAFASHKPAALVVERAPTGHLLVQPLINGRELGWFIFDTGAGICVLDQSVADELALPALATIAAKGTGGAKPSPMHRLKTIELGPVTLREPVVIAIDLAFLTVPLGRKIAGVVGYDFIARCVAEMSLADGTIALHEPGKFELKSGKWDPITMLGRVPAIEAVFEGHRGWITLDTGSNVGMTFNHPAVEKFKLLDGRETTASQSGGVGGTTPMMRGKLKSLEFAGRKFEDIDASFAAEPRGVFGTPYAAGVIGGPVLKKFRLVLDYSGGQIALVDQP